MRRKFWGMRLIILLALLITLSLIIGPAGFSFSISLRVRLPRILLGIFAGGILSFTGASLQGLLQNPLVDPYILGIASGAAFGYSIGLLLGLDPSILPVFGFLGGVFTMFLVYSIARIRGRLSKAGIILSGVIVSFLFSSLIMLLLVFSHKPLSQIIYILMGNLGFIFSKRTLTLFIIVAGLSIPALFGIYIHWRDLNILSTTEDVAKSLGVATDRLTRVIFVLSSLLTGFVVSFCGAISFIGLIVPHIIRLILGPDHSTLLPASFLLGASLLLLSDLIARSIAPVELPLSVVTSLFGVPFFIYLLKKRL